MGPFGFGCFRSIETSTRSAVIAAFRKHFVTYATHDPSTVGVQFKSALRFVLIPCSSYYPVLPNCLPVKFITVAVKEIELHFHFDTICNLCNRYFVLYVTTTVWSFGRFITNAVPRAGQSASVPK